jgi:hypothetical protein
MRRLLALATVAASLVACAVLVLAPAVPAAKGGNSANAKRCQKGGYKDWVRADQTTFANVGKCVSYAARGGTLTEPTPAEDRAYCAPAGPPTFGQCFVPGFMDLDFDASSGPLGENPTGTFLFESLPAHWGGDVTCLEVTGNVASVGGVITDSNDAPVGSGFSFTVTDNAPDAVSFPTFSASPPTADTPGCGSLSPGDSLGDLTGDIVVDDS